MTESYYSHRFYGLLTKNTFVWLMFMLWALMLCTAVIICIHILCLSIFTTRYYRFDLNFSL